MKYDMLFSDTVTYLRYERYKKTMKGLFQEIVIFIVQGKNYSSVTKKVKSYVFVCYAICSLFYSAISD